MKILKPLGGVVALTVAVLGLSLQPVSPAAAEAGTDIPITVTADAYATDDSGQITSASEFLWDSAKTDDPENAYKIAYRGSLDMKKLWQEYAKLRTAWLLKNGFDQKRWREKTFTGQWQISFSVDASVVSATEKFTTCEALQAEVLKQNPGTQLGTFIRCSAVTYDSSTGLYSANFTLVNADGGKVSGAQLDGEYRNPNASVLRLTTPPLAFFVPQSHFEIDKSFAMTSPTVTGEMRMDAFYIGMPLRFNATGNDVSLKMVTTYDAIYEYASAAAGRDLPSDVEALLPPNTTMLRDGAVVTPEPPAQTEVADAQGLWTFAGWEPATQTVAGQNVSFVGSWTYTVDPEALFWIRHTFAAVETPPATLRGAIDARSSELPGAVLELLPDDFEAQQGAVVTPVPLETESITTAAGTWTFEGWSPSAATVDGFDVSFVGGWSFAKTPDEPGPPAGPMDPEAPELPTVPGPPNGPTDPSDPTDPAKPVTPGKPTPPVVSPPNLSKTGSDTAIAGGISAAALFGLGAAIYLIGRRRNRG